MQRRMPIFLACALAHSTYNEGKRAQRSCGWSASLIGRENRRRPGGRCMAGEATRAQHAAKSAGLVVVTGVFDLLHIGHLRFLEAARRLGGSLAVGVEDDE